MDAFLDAVAFGPGRHACVVTIGNIHGQGEVLLSRVAELPRAVPAEVG
jgi:gamma-polyglutamate synthase